MPLHLTLIAAMDAHNGIGTHNQLPWHLPQDLAHFKRATLSHPVIMGRKTFESIGRPLPNRRNIVITRNHDWQHEDVQTAPSIEAAMALVNDASSEVSAFIIGGGQIFADTLHLAQRLIITHIEHTFDCDAFFPTIDPEIWQETTRDTHHSEAAGFSYAYVTYERKKPLAMPDTTVV